MLSIANGTVANDQIYLRQKVKENIKKYVDEILPSEYEKCLNGLSLILMEAWDLSDRAGAEHPTDKIHALALAKKAYTTKLLTNISVIEDTYVIIEKKKELEQQSSSSLRRQPMEQPP